MPETQMSPFPLSFSNGRPALTVVLLAAAMLERDGYFVLAGLLMLTLTAVYFSTLLLGWAALTEWLHQWGSHLVTGGSDDVGAGLCSDAVQGAQDCRGVRQPDGTSP
ncbi:MAG: hypothetical protein FJ395_01150 [Verrucomicrobia bacterium]|nr:hypothetical protein [Verrucomicrobiota bacterium]